MAKLIDLSGIWSNNELTEREREMLFPLWKAQQDIADATKDYILACRRMAERAATAANVAEDREILSEGRWLWGDGEKAAAAEQRASQAAEQQRALLSMLKAASPALFESVVERENGPEPALAN